MDDAETPATRPASPKPDPAPTPSEAELSRMAREAVRQPADPRLDRQLERMGLADPPVATPAAANGSGEVARLRDQVRTLQILVAVLVAVVVILLVIEAIQLLG